MKYLFLIVSFCFMHLVLGQKQFKDEDSFSRYIEKQLHKSGRKDRSEFFMYLPQKECRAELRILKNALEEGQPQLYKYASKAEVDEAFERAYKLCRGGIKYKTYLKELGRIQHVISAGHSNWRHSPAYLRYAEENETYFPFDIRYEGDDCKIYRNCSRNVMPVPDNVNLISINGHSISDIIQELKKCTDRDGASNDRSYQSVTEVFSFLYTSFVGTPEVFEIKYFDQEMEIEMTMKVEGLSIKEINENRNKRYVVQERNVLFSNYDGASSYFGVQTFVHSDLKSGGYDYDNFTHDFFKKVQENNTKELYIDLRGNRGGALTNASLLLSYLIQDTVEYISTEVKKMRGFSYERLFLNWYEYPDTTTLDTIDSRFFIVKKQRIIPASNKYTGKMFVITDNLTQSSAASICSILKESSNAVFIGEETGAPRVGSGGNPAMIKLPFSKISYIFPQAWHRNLGVSGTSNDKGVQPDIPIYNKPMEFYDWPFYMDKVKEYERSDRK